MKNKNHWERNYVTYPHHFNKIQYDLRQDLLKILRKQTKLAENI